MQVSAKEVSERLAAKVDSVVPMLLPGGKQSNAHWVCGDISGGLGDSLKVQMTGDNAGNWMDWANQEYRGDLIDLWRFTKGLTLSDAFKEAKSYLGIVDGMRQIPKKYEKPQMGKTKPISNEVRAMRFLTEERKISKSTIEQFGIEIIYGKENNVALAFPCHSPQGELINRSYRTVPSDGGPKKVWQDKGCAPCLFGWQALPSSAYESRTVLLSEGQIDCMSWHQWGIPALSIPNGSGGTWIEYEWDNLAAFDHIYLSFDMDGAGSDIVSKAVERLGSHRCLIVKIPGKDANKCLMDGATAEEAKSWVANAKPPRLPGMILACDLVERLEIELSTKMEPSSCPLFKISWEAAMGFYPHPGDVTLWSGQTGHGKSSFLNYLMLGKVSNQEKVFIASMEVKPERTIAKMISCFAKTDKFDMKAAANFLKIAGGHVIFADVIGYIEPEKLLEMMWFSYRRYDCKNYCIDSLMRVNGLEENFPAQGNFMNKLQEFTKTTGSNVELVCHPRKSSTGHIYNEMDIKGSSLIPNNADNVVTISRNLEKEKLRKEGALNDELSSKMHDTEVRVEKQRELGWTGMFRLNYNHITHRFSPFKG